MNDTPSFKEPKAKMRTVSINIPVQALGVQEVPGQGQAGEWGDTPMPNVPPVRTFARFLPSTSASKPNTDERESATTSPYNSQGLFNRDKTTIYILNERAVVIFTLNVFLR